MERDSATFQDKGTEIPSLSRDIGTSGQAQNLAEGRDGPGEPVKIWGRTRDWTVPDFDSPYLPVLQDKMGQSIKGCLKQDLNCKTLVEPN